MSGLMRATKLPPCGSPRSRQCASNSSVSLESPVPDGAVTSETLGAAPAGSTRSSHARRRLRICSGSRAVGSGMLAADRPDQRLRDHLALIGAVAVEHLVVKTALEEQVHV